MYTIGQLCTAIYRNLQILLGRKLRDINIKNGQYDFFYAISLWEGLSQKDLSERLFIGKATTAKAVKDLVQKGYVFKEKDEKDGRVDHLYLTEKGKATAPMIAQIFRSNLDVCESGLTDAEMSTLLTLLEKVLINLDKENGDRHDR